MKPLAAVRLLSSLLALATVVSACPAGDDRKVDGPAGSGRIAYVDDDVVAVRPADGSGSATALIPATSEFLAGPHFNPAGVRVLYFSTGPMGGALYEVTADGKGVPRQVTPFEVYALGGGYSADGARIVFYAQPEGTGNDRTERDIYVIGADGTGLQRLTDDALEDAEPAFLPDGRIVWAKQPAGAMLGYRELFVMNGDGSNARALTNGGSAKYNPAVSPDGAHIAFDASELFIMNADGTGLRSVGRGTFPAFSPDGSRLAYSDGGTRLATMALDGSDVVPLFAGTHPSWAR